MLEEKLFYQNYNVIKRVIHNSYNSIFYSKLYNDAGLDLKKDFRYEHFIKIPSLTKKTYALNKLFMMTNNLINLQTYDRLKFDINAKREYLNSMGLQLKITSGSTGIPLEIIKSDRDNKKDYYTLNYYRRKLTNYNFRGKFLWIWPVNPLTRKYLYSSLKVVDYIKINDRGYQYMLYEHSDNKYCELYNLIKNENFEWLTSSPSVLSNLATYMEKYGLSLGNIKYIECHSEYLYSWQSEIIAKVFGIEPVSIYSSNEVQFIGYKCLNDDNYHLFTNSCYIEFIKDDNGIGEIYVTSLNYMDFPIIRYKLGDCGEWFIRNGCSCNLKHHPTFRLSEFRRNDFIITKKGDYLEPFIITDSIILMKNHYDFNLDRYRVIQENYDSFIYYFPNEYNYQIHSDMEVFLQKYLSELLKYKVKVDIVYIDFNTMFNDGRKFKYFETNSGLLRKRSRGNYHGKS